VITKRVCVVWSFHYGPRARKKIEPKRYNIEGLSSRYSTNNVFYYTTKLRGGPRTRKSIGYERTVFDGYVASKIFRTLPRPKSSFSFSFRWFKSASGLVSPVRIFIDEFVTILVSLGFYRFTFATIGVLTFNISCHQALK